MKIVISSFEILSNFSWQFRFIKYQIIYIIPQNSILSKWRVLFTGISSPPPTDRHTSPGQDAAAAAEQNTEPRQLILISVTLVQQIVRQAPAQEGWVRGDTVLRETRSYN